jgi:hypothetical protein
VIWRFLFRGELGEGQAQSRTEPENDGIEIRDLVFANKLMQAFGKTSKISTLRLRSWLMRRILAT